MIDPHETTIPAEALTSETWMPLSELRWRGARLQQQWMVETRKHSGLAVPTISMRHEWRDVPEVPADAE